MVMHGIYIFVNERFCNFTQIWKAFLPSSAGVDSMWMRKTFLNSYSLIHPRDEGKVSPVWVPSRPYFLFFFPANNSSLKLNWNYLSMNKAKFKKRQIWLKFYGILAPNEASNRRQMCCRGPNTNQPSQSSLPLTCCQLLVVNTALSGLITRASLHLFTHTICDTADSRKLLPINMRLPLYEVAIDAKNRLELQQWSC